MNTNPNPEQGGRFLAQGENPPELPEDLDPDVMAAVSRQVQDISNQLNHTESTEYVGAFARPEPEEPSETPEPEAAETAPEEPVPEVEAPVEEGFALPEPVTEDPAPEAMELLPVPEEKTVPGYLAPQDQDFAMAYGGEEVQEEQPQMEEPQQLPPPEEAPEEGSGFFRSDPERKGRPKHKKGEGFFGIPNILVTLVWLALTVVIGVTLGRMLWICASDVLAFGQEDRQVTITIYENDDIDAITNKLYSARLIKYPGLFKLYASFAVDEGEIHPGIWDLNAKYDYHALVKMMAPSSSREVVTVMIPEGYSCRQIFTLLEENRVCTVQAMSDYAANGELGDYWFLEDVERGDKYCLEGFLFPDTYEFYKNDSPKNVLLKMLDNFDLKFDEEMVWQLDQLNGQLADIMRATGKNQEYIDSHLLSLRDVVTIASMVEKETANAEEGHTVASVIYNRLYNWGSTPPYLNIDATIIYALDGKTELTADDLRVDSPYNTYTHTGLIPGPIANPGLSSLEAALEPAKTDYYFYVLDPETGSHHFSRTQEEHEAFRASIS